jgi:hypothetical protein
MNTLGISKNYPKEADVESMLKNANEPHRLVGKVDKIGSLKINNTYYHVFSGTLEQNTYRIIIFDNEKKYLGYYYTGVCEPIDLFDNGRDYAKGIILSTMSKRSPSISIGKEGPWEKFSTPTRTEHGDFIFYFVNTADYSFPEINTEIRDWRLKGDGAVVRGKLAMLTRKEIYLQLPNGSIKRFNKPKSLSRDDEEYLEPRYKGLR